MSIADKLTQIAENEQRVYEAGKKAEADFFEDEFHGYGKRVAYSYAWCRWTTEMFRRTFHNYKSLTTNDFEGTFYNSRMDVDLPAFLEELGATINVVNPSRYAYQRTFKNAYFTRIGVIDVSTSEKNGCYFSETFSACTKLKTIDKIILNSNGADLYNNAFSRCSALENLTIEGVIGQNGFSVQDCKLLSKASHISIVNALSSTTSGLTVTFSKQAVNKAFETSEGAADGSTSAEWLALANTKSNWTISLV